MPGRATEDGRVMVESSDRTWSAVEGNAKSLQYSYLENTMNSGGGGRCLVAKSCLTLAIPRTVACQAPLSMGFSRQEYWSGLPFPSPWYLPYPGIKPGSPALQANSLPSDPLKEVLKCVEHTQILKGEIYGFSFSYCSWGSQGKNTEVVCQSLLLWTTFCQNSPP